MKRCQLWIDAIKSTDMHQFLILYDSFHLSDPPLPPSHSCPVRVIILFGVHTKLIGHARGNWNKRVAGK